MNKRQATIRRTTNETDISLSLTLEGQGIADVETGDGFLDHMLILFASHGRFDLKISAIGDLYVDGHHTVEDVGICLGQALAAALGDKKGIRRFGDVTVPMDEALILSAVDLSGRSYFGSDLSLPSPRLGSFDTELVEEFFLGFTRNANCTLHFHQFAGRNTHHIIEGAFKAFGRALREAVRIDPELAGDLPSTKGVL